jgi:hypothetical protein
MDGIKKATTRIDDELNNKKPPTMAITDELIMFLHWQCHPHSFERTAMTP